MAGQLPTTSFVTAPQLADPAATLLHMQQQAALHLPMKPLIDPAVAEAKKQKAAEKRAAKKAKQQDEEARLLKEKEEAAAAAALAAQILADEATPVAVVTTVTRLGKDYMEQDGFLFDLKTRECAGFWNEDTGEIEECDSDSDEE